MPETVFDRVAEVYDAERPGYPEALVADVVALAALAPGARILELGSGTGKASLPFAQRGYALTCVEPGPAMRAVAERKLRGYEVRFADCSFEDWPLEREAFALVTCAQAWHWIDPGMRAAKAADALAPGGSLALFWNRADPPPAEQAAALDAIYREHAPDLDRTRTGSAVGRVPPGIADELAASGRFETVVERSYPWRFRHDGAGYVRLLSTHSEHLKLPEARREALFAALEAAIDGFGGQLDSPHQTWLYLARRR